MTAAHTTPLDRPASSDELRWLAIMLEGLPAQFDVYQDQIDGLRVDGTCDCGCGTVDVVPRSDAPVGSHKRAIVGDGHVDWSDHSLGDVLVFISEGKLSMLEFVYYLGDIGDVRPIGVWSEEPRERPSGTSEGRADQRAHVT